MLNFASFRKRPRKPELLAPASLTPDMHNMPRNSFEPQVGQIADQLLAAYGSAACSLAKQTALLALERGDTDRFATWCLVIVALEKLNLRFKGPGASESWN